MHFESNKHRSKSTATLWCGSAAAEKGWRMIHHVREASGMQQSREGTKDSVSNLWQIISAHMPRSATSRTSTAMTASSISPAITAPSEASLVQTYVSIQSSFN